MGQGSLDAAISATRKVKGTPQIEAQGTHSAMSLGAIKPRPHAQTREPSPTHVAALLESIEAVGLISPIAVDANGVLLAGLHRLDAIKALQETTPTRFDELFGAGVPVRRFDFDAVTDPGQALNVEVTENNQRRDYSPKEVRQLADRLIAEGYVHRDGRPRKGEKALQPALAIALGKSKRTVERLLAASQEPVKSSTPVEVSIWTKRRSTLRKWRDDSITLDNGPQLVEAIDRVLELLREVDRP